jgi:hypothetical protein
MVDITGSLSIREGMIVSLIERLQYLYYPMPTKITPDFSYRSKDIIISSVISIVITLVFGYYFLYVGIRERRPTFYVDPTRTTILDKETAASAPLLLLRSNGDTINSSVTSAYFYFFNQGEETIKQANIYAPLKIVLGEKAEILDFKILKVARPVSGIEVSRDTLSNSLDIQLKAMERDDGVVGQIIFEGKKDASITMEGGIDGVKYFETHLSSINPLYFMVAIVIFLIAAYIFLVLSKRHPKNSSKLLFFFSAIPILYLLLMLYKTQWFVSQEVPTSLQIEQYQEEKSDWYIPAWFKR